MGGTVTLTADWTDGADFDWNKVQLLSQTKGRLTGENIDEGYFSWDAANHTLKALKSSDGVDVYMRFAYEGLNKFSTPVIAIVP